ncbi:MAG: DUF6034 family protein [Christensenellales bacterium]
MKKHMKSCLMLAACLWLLCAPALAQTVPGMVQAPAHVNRRFASNTGKTVIEVDANVLVPKAEAAYILPVEIRAFEEEDAQRLALLIDPDAPWQKDTADERTGAYRSTAWFRWLFDRQLDKQTNVTVSNMHLPEGACVSTLLSYEVRWDDRYRTKGTVNYLAREGREIPGEGIAGHALTTRQAADIARDFVRRVTQEPFALFTMSAVSGVIFDDELILSNRHWRGESYKAVFTRQVAGMPVLASYVDLDYYGRKDIFAVPVGYEELSVTLDAQGQVSNFMWYHRYQVADAGDACQLLPFDSILDIAGKILPLKFAGNEREEEQLVRINRIQLGYMPVLQRDSGQAFQLTPVWNFYGLNERDFEEDPHHSEMNEAHLTVNALDGTVIDPAYGY